MASEKSLAFIHNTSLPQPLGVLSTALTAWIQEVCIRPNIPQIYNITVLDLADYNLDESRGMGLKSREDWNQEINEHAGFILLIPYHTWSYCSSFKSAFSQPLQGPRRPIFFLGFGKEERWDRPMQKKCYPMMRQFFEGKGMKVIGVDEPQWEGEKCRMGIGYPEFIIYADYWEDWITGGYNAFLGGQQEEAFESRGWNRCQEGVKKMVDGLEGRVGKRR